MSNLASGAGGEGIRELSAAIKSEVSEDAKDLSTRVFSEVFADMMRVPRRQFLEYVRDSWMKDPKFRMELLDRVAPKGPLDVRTERGLRMFRAIVTDAFKSQEDPTPEDDPINPQRMTPEVAAELSDDPVGLSAYPFPTRPLSESPPPAAPPTTPPAAPPMAPGPDTLAPGAQNASVPNVP